MEARIRERMKRVAPRVAGLREPVTQDNERPFPRFGDVHCDPVGCDFSMPDVSHADFLVHGVRRGRGI